jgi:hypothetical protein
MLNKNASRNLGREVLASARWFRELKDADHLVRTLPWGTQAQNNAIDKAVGIADKTLLPLSHKEGVNETIGRTIRDKSGKQPARSNYDNFQVEIDPPHPFEIRNSLQSHDLQRKLRNYHSDDLLRKLRAQRGE